ncbi:lymphocyte antigen 6 complex locus protein G6f-like [Notechis scutatus]|uniref:Lymphocyte antigen 6 complex locus protein G6f-like n=1 Tax=Notechis scutatus TaxID=8663 RepID=A0A6J1VML2_9SAUR|nr:lymphocyte antigen 6 complex locus protein G6f-like [Notechis scutatus]
MVLWKNLPSEMDAVVSTPRTATTAVLATLFLLVQLCDANNVYAKRGSSLELPCPCQSCSGTQEMSWYYAQQGKTVLLFRKFSNDHIKRFPNAWSWLEMLQNNSLQFHHVRDNDTGRYWCDMNHFYDLVVVTSNQQRMESYQADSVCYILSCLFPSKKYYRDVITWWEDRKQILDTDQMGRPSIFKGERASQLHICMKKEALEKSMKKQVKCSFARKTHITFKLTDNHHDLCTCSTLMPSFQGCRRTTTSASYFILLVTVPLEPESEEEDETELGHTEEQPEKQGEAVPGPLGLGTVASEGEGVQEDQAMEEDRAGSRAEEQ